MSSPLITIIGSSNMDMVVKADRIPEPGETILSGSFFMNPGGKGANQAVAVAKLGGNAVFISKLGNDLFGEQFAGLFKKEGINTRYLLSDPVLPSGVALITVDKKGENSIVVAQGANANMQTADLSSALETIASGKILLMQLEIPLDTVTSAAEYAHSKGVMVILNPAPACHLPDKLLQQVDLLTPNRSEASLLSGITITDVSTAQEAAMVLHRKGVKHVVITMGAEGAIIYTNGKFIQVDAIKVTPVDTTAAGDVFNGAVAVALSEGNDLETAVRFGCRAAAIAVTRPGAQSSIPYRNEL